MFGKLSFKGGVHPPYNKGQTEALTIEVLPPPDKVIIPLSMHIGAPAKVVVKRGDRVKIGQVLAEPGGFVSSPAHSSVSGEVSSIGDFPHPLGHHLTAIEITNDKNDDLITPAPLDKDWREAAPGEIVQKIAASGIVGMGGASFPTHVKLSPPGDKKINTLIINGSECEPYLTADHRMLLEKADEILCGTLILRKILGTQKTYIGIEDNKPDAIETINSKLSDEKFNGIKLIKLHTKYPQGGEKQLINAITKREVPSGGLPMDVGCLVQNVGTAFAVWDAVCNGMPLYQRVATVTGPTVKKPANLLIRIGTPIKYVLEYCGVDLAATKKVIMGGPMMGLAQPELDAPVIKSTSGLLAIGEIHEGIKTNDCISCGHCLKACPIHLSPSLIAKFVNKGLYDDAGKWNVLDCIECGACAFVCPSKINLVHFFKLGKHFVMAAQKAKAKEE